MRTIERDKQKFYYSLFVEMRPKYAEKDGKPIVEYIDEDGNEYYRETGEFETIYTEPKEFWASISATLNEIQARSFGVDQSSIYSVLHCTKGYVPLTFEAKIWKDSEIRWKDEEKRIPDADSSDYTIKGVLDEFLNFDFFLLRRNN